ncbi:PHP domain-containing protein, partial [Parasphingorhabdus sp.]|uniref:PHP domain-containing protein n=1 Tax=Parasphingorhabdus sp. TaxID=2709688 RepID=UPI003001A115
MTAFAELAASTHYSFLRGASSPADMVMQAMALGMTGIGIADRNNVAGVVRAHATLRRAHEEAAEEGLVLPDFKLIVGSRLVFADETPEVIVYPLGRRGWGRLTRLLSTGNLRAEKGECCLYEADLLEWCSEDWALIILPEASASGRRTVSQSEAAADGGGAGGASAGSGIALQHPADGSPPPASR